MARIKAIFSRFRYVYAYAGNRKKCYVLRECYVNVTSFVTKKIKVISGTYPYYYYLCYRNNNNIRD